LFHSVSNRYASAHWRPKRPPCYVSRMQRPPAHTDAGKRLTALLVSRGFSERAFARRAGIPRGTLRRSLAGYEPGVTTALAICEALRVAPSRIWTARVTPEAAAT